MSSKKIKYLVFLFSTIIFWGMDAYAQDEKAKTQHSEEEFKLDTMPEKTLGKKYNYTNRAQEEKTQMIKLCFSASANINLLPSPNIIPYVAFEKKMATEWSYLAGGGIGLGPNGKLDGAVRYYYGLSNRIKKGKSVNNFSANYFSIQGSLLYNNLGTNLNNNPIKSQAQLLYGVQRRLNKYLFIDINAGVYYDNYANDLNDMHGIISAHFGLLF